MAVWLAYILVCGSIITVLITLIDKFFWAPKRKHAVHADDSTPPKMPWFVEQCRSFWPVFVIVLIVKTFIFQPFWVPTGSLEPTVMTNDFLLVTQYNYGLHAPLWRKLLLPTGKPNVGDIVVFHWPVNPKVDFIKRVVGVPGDKISYINKVFYVNGVEAKQKFLGYAEDSNSPNGPHWKVKIMQEDLNGVKHKIYVCADTKACPTDPHPQNFYNLVVPKGEYLMIGDNRDDSDDSRDWGFVKASALVGKGRFIFFGWNSAKHNVRWSQIGNVL